MERLSSTPLRPLPTLGAELEMSKAPSTPESQPQGSVPSDMGPTNSSAEGFSFKELGTSPNDGVPERADEKSKAEAEQSNTVVVTGHGRERASPCAALTGEQHFGLLPQELAESRVDGVKSSRTRNQRAADRTEDPVSIYTLRPHLS